MFFAQEQLRLEALQAEEAQLTFAPAINPCYSIVSRPLLDLADPAPYLAHANAQCRRLEALRQQAAEERKVRGSFMLHLETGNMSECSSGFWQLPLSSIESKSERECAQEDGNRIVS